MQVRAVAVAIALTLAARQSLPRTSTIVATVTAYVSEYQHGFVQLVADEDTTQRVIAGSAVTATRRTHGELFSTFIDEQGGWMSVHDIQTVDDTPVTGRQDVRALLRSESVRELGPRLAAENARFNLGHVSRNFNEPTLALLLFSRGHVGDLSVKTDGRAQFDGDTRLVTLQVALDKDAPLVRSLAGRVSTTATFVVEPDTGRVRHTTLRLDDGDVSATLETQYGFDSHVAAWVPFTFSERYTARRAAETTEVVTSLTNYRRFEVSVRMKPGD